MTQAADSSEAVSIAVVGNGWRAASFLRLCRLFPDRLRATAVVTRTSGYHAVALIRALLGVGFEDVTVRALRTEFELANPIARDGWTHDLSPRPAWNVLAHLDFGGGRSGLYGFTDNQWHNELRSNRILVRGSLGEIAQDQVVHVRDERTVVESQLVRRRFGVDMNFEGFDLGHITFEGEPVFRNQWQGGRLADDEIAVADLLLAAGRWARGSGPAPYPLAQACQDHMISLAIDEAVSRGRRVVTTRQPWATAKVDG